MRSKNENIHDKPVEATLDFRIGLQSWIITLFKRANLANPSLCFFGFISTDDCGCPNEDQIRLEYLVAGLATLNKSVCSSNSSTEAR